MLIKALSPFPNFFFLEVTCLNFSFIVATILDSSNKVVVCLFDESYKYDKLAACLSNESCNCLTISSSFRCPCDIVLSAIIGAKTVIPILMIQEENAKLRELKEQFSLVKNNSSLFFPVTFPLFI